VGPDHIAIGTDRAYLSELESDAIYSDYQWFSPKQFSDFWPENDSLFDPHWGHRKMHESLEWTNFPLFTVGLVQRGHSDEAIRKIIGGTVLRVLAEVAATANNKFA